MAGEKRINRQQIIVLAGVVIVFIVALQFYVTFDKKTHKQVGDLINHSFAAIEGSREGDGDAVFISDDPAIYHQLLQELENTTFKPTNRTPANRLSQVHVFNEDLEIATTLIVRENHQFEVNGELFTIDDTNLVLFESSLFSEEHELVLRNREDVVEAIEERLFSSLLISEENRDWAEVIALLRVASERKINLTEIGLLVMSPTKEVLKQLLSYEISDIIPEYALFEAIRKERNEMVELMLDHDLEITNDETYAVSMSPVVAAKLNGADKLVDSLLAYGFEDVDVESKHVEAARKAVDFTSDEPEKIIENLKQGQLPGVDIRLPVSTKEIIEDWGDYIFNLLETPILSYNQHHFQRMVSQTGGDSEQLESVVYSYLYEFDANDRMHEDEMIDVLGEPTFTDNYGGLSEMGYLFGNYRLAFVMDEDGQILTVSFTEKTLQWYE